MDADGDLVTSKLLGWDKKSDENWSYDDLLLEGGMMEWDEPCAVYPEIRNARLHAQRGSFTIHGDEYEPLDEFFPYELGSKPEKGSQTVLRKVCLPKEALPDAKRFLAQAGVDHHLMFPDLEGLTRSLKMKYSIG